MPRPISILLFLLIPVAGFSQTSETKYFNDRFLQKETKHGNFSQTITKNADGTVTTEIKNVRKDKLISSTSFKGNEPTGIWRYGEENSSEQLDYSFDLVYSDAACTDTVAGLKNWFENDDKLKYTAPKILPAGQELYRFLGSKIRYPDDARDNNIQGKVVMVFTITDKGKIENIVVKKSAHVVLDKEAVRVMRKLELGGPPMLDGRPKGMCVTMPIAFTLE